MKRPSPIGAVTIITAIMVLCMTVFAALAYSSGEAELRLAQAGAQAVSDYYAADKQAADLVSMAIGGSSEQDLLAFCATGVNYATPTAVEYDGYTLTADIPAGARQTLHIEVEIEEGTAHIVEWRTVADTDIEGIDIFG